MPPKPFSDRVYLAKVALPDFAGICSTDILPILPGPDLDRKFLCYYLRQQSVVDYANSRVTGVNLPRLSPSALSEFPIPLPPLAEQKRIAGILDAADALRAKRRESLAQLDTFLQSTFLDLFGDPVTNPKEFDTILLGTLAKRITKGESPKWQGYEYQTDGMLFVTSENVRLGEIDLTKPKFLSLEFNKKIARSELKLGDVLVNLVGASIGRSCIFPGYSKPANVNQAVGVVTLGPRMLSSFLAGLLLTDRGQKMLLNHRVDAARANISLTDLRNLNVPFPPLPLQHRFAEIVESVERQKTRLRAHLTELDTLFASLQSRAFRGEL
ncbi:MAG: restriction endonuclease subunit S [Opitutales bacterium]